MKKKIDELRQLCPGGVTIQIDEHKLYNETAEQWIESDIAKEFKGMNPKILRGMMEHNTIYRVECFPTGLGVVLCAHWNLETALASCLTQIRAMQVEAMAKVNAN